MQRIRTNVSRFVTNAMQATFPLRCAHTHTHTHLSNPPLHKAFCHPHTQFFSCHVGNCRGRESCVHVCMEQSPTQLCLEIQGHVACKRFWKYNLSCIVYLSHCAVSQKLNYEDDSWFTHPIKSLRVAGM